MSEIETMLIRQEICELKARYFRLLDCKDWAGFEALFCPDALTDFRDSGGEIDESLLISGAAAFVSRLAPMLENVTTVHHGHMPEIVVESATSARGIWAMEDKLWPGPGSVLPFGFMHGYGHYHERYARLADGWRIAEIRMARLRVGVA